MKKRIGRRIEACEAIVSLQSITYLRKLTCEHDCAEKGNCDTYCCNTQNEEGGRDDEATANGGRQLDSFLAGNTNMKLLPVLRKISAGNIRYRHVFPV